MSTDSSGNYTLLQADGEKAVVPVDDVEEIRTARKSVMPERLLDELTLSEISDLFAFLGMLPTQSVARRPNEERSR